MKMGPWAAEIKAIQKSAEHMTDAAGEFSTWLDEAAGGRTEDPEGIRERARGFLTLLRQELQQVSQGGVSLFKQLCSGPVAKLLAGAPLTREEWLLLQAMGIPLVTAKAIGVAPLDDFALLSLLRWEDGARQAYINPDLSPTAPPEGQPGLRFGVAPEEVRVSALRPEQRAFFRRYWPAVFARFTPE